MTADPAISLDTLVADIAFAFSAADARRPAWVSQRSGRQYMPGLGPQAENAAVELMLTELTSRPAYRAVACGQFLPYPDAPRQKCDLWIGTPVIWAIEVKMARFRGDNGKPDDTAVKDILSPYESDRSALTDATKLATAGFPAHTAIVIYGFDYPDRPLDPAIDAYETLARERVNLGERAEAAMRPLVHPVHALGRVFGWEISPRHRQAKG
jgi:hypothetical protein